MMQPPTLMRKFLLSKLVTSQSRLDELYLPPEIPVGELYAATLRTVAMSLTYGPFFPPAYAIGSLYLMMNQWGIKWAICHWYRRPHTTGESMLTQAE